MDMRTTYMCAQESNELENVVAHPIQIWITAIYVRRSASRGVLHHWYLVVRREKVITNSVTSDDNSRYTFEGHDVSQ